MSILTAIRQIVVLVGILVCSTAWGQQPIYLEDALAMADHLISAGKLEDARYVVDRATDAGQAEGPLNKRKIKILYLQGMYSEADSLLQTSTNPSSLWERQMKLRAGEALGLPSEDATHYDVELLQYMAYHTLNGHRDTVRSVMDQHDFKDDAMANVEFNLFLSVVNQQKIKTDKKPWIGGVLSTLIPGTGRIYAGRAREGLTSVLPILIYGSQAAEGFYFAGFSSPHFYGFSPIALVFYGANIAGSVRAVKRTNQQRIEQLHHEVYHQLDPLVLQR